MFQLKTKITQWVAHIKTFKDYFFPVRKARFWSGKLYSLQSLQRPSFVAVLRGKSQSYDIDFGNHNRNDKIKAEGLKPCCIVN